MKKYLLPALGLLLGFLLGLGFALWWVFQL
jgi:hypothetical protein